METTLICALTRKRAIEIARERAGALRSLEQNKMRYSGALDGGDWEWAYIGDLASIFGRPAGIRVILDKSAQRLNEWLQIIQYIARNDFRCEWVGDWGRREWGFVENDLSRALVKELEGIGYCAVCKKEAIQIYLYEKPGLLHFRHAGGKECRVALDMNNLAAAVRTLAKVVRMARAEAENPLIAVQPGAQQAKLEARVAKQDELKQQLWDMPSAVTLRIAGAPAEPPKPVLPPVIQRNTIRKVKFD